jgi:hypothetical protein
MAVLRSAESIAEARGWGLDTRREVRRALAFLLADYQPDDVIPASTVQTLAALGMAVERTSEILAELGLLRDDLTSRLDVWLASKLRPLGPRIREETNVWVDHPSALAMSGHGHGCQPRSASTCWWSPRSWSRGRRSTSR